MTPRESGGTILELALSRPLQQTRSQLRREQTRAENLARYLESQMPLVEFEFRCECARPSCAIRLPLDVERHRREPGRYIVGIDHADGDTVVGVADRFFIVEAPIVFVPAHGARLKTADAGVGQ
jgi:hypothetical protein